MPYKALGRRATRLFVLLRQWRLAYKSSERSQAHRRYGVRAYYGLILRQLIWFRDRDTWGEAVKAKPHQRPVGFT